MAHGRIGCTNVPQTVPVHSIGHDVPAPTKKGSRVETLFSRAAVLASRQAGRAHTFILAVVAVIVWAGFGPSAHFSDTWELVINTATTIVTFLMVFLVQHTQNRDTLAIMLKLDELIEVNQQASNRMLKLEDLTEEQLEAMHTKYKNRAEDGTNVSDHRS